MQTKHFHGNAMLLNDRIIIDDSLKSVSCYICGNIFKIDLKNWEEARNYICESCKLEMNND